MLKWLFNWLKAQTQGELETQEALKNKTEQDAHYRAGKDESPYSFHKEEVND
jgi:hypothetical protein